MAFKGDIDIIRVTALYAGYMLAYLLLHGKTFPLYIVRSDDDEGDHHVELMLKKNEFLTALHTKLLHIVQPRHLLHVLYTLS